MPTGPACLFVNNSQRNYSRYSSRHEVSLCTSSKFQVCTSPRSRPAVSCVPGLSHLKKGKRSDIWGSFISSRRNYWRGRFLAGDSVRGGSRQADGPLCVFLALQKTSCRDDRRTRVGHYFTRNLLKYKFRRLSTKGSGEQLNSRPRRNKTVALNWANGRRIKDFQKINLEKSCGGVVSRANVTSDR